MFNIIDAGNALDSVPVVVSCGKAQGLQLSALETVAIVTTTESVEVYMTTPSSLFFLNTFFMKFLLLHLHIV